MKPIFKEFRCPKCRKLRYIKVNGICYDCNTKKNLLVLAKQRRLQHKLDFLNQSLSIESFN